MHPNLIKVPTFIGASMPLRAPRSNLVVMAIQYCTLNPNSVLNTTLKSKNVPFLRYRVYIKKAAAIINDPFKINCTHTEATENIMMGFLPTRSATTPQKNETKNRPTK